jgi:hypothetical protein
MPVSRLLVEGRLEIELFGSLLAGNPVADPRPSGKTSLAPRTRDIRRDQRVITCYIRDRDFDFLPPGDLSQPTVDTMETGLPLGWRWCRHEIENYLIEPELINATFGWDRATFEAQLVNAARSIRHYLVARWTVGQVFPPDMAFESKPTECVGHEFRLPVDLTEAGTTAWIQMQAATCITTVQTALAPTAVTNVLAAHTTRLTDAFLEDVTNILLWCSGKDLLSSLMPWLQTTHGLHPAQLRTRVRDWITSHPDETFALLPEWAAFRNLLRTYPYP